MDVSPPGRSRARDSTASNTVLFCQSPDKAGADTDVEQSPSPSAFRPRENHSDSVSSRPPISSWMDQDSLPPSLKDDSWKGWFRIRGDGNCAIRAVIAGLSLQGSREWVNTIGAALGDTAEESDMVGELCSQSESLEEAISLDHPEERLARLSALMDDSDWTTAIRKVLAVKVAALPTTVAGDAKELTQDGASLAFHEVGALGSLLGCGITIHSTLHPDKPFSVGVDKDVGAPNVLLYHHDGHFDLLCPTSAAPQSVSPDGTDGGRPL